MHCPALVPALPQELQTPSRRPAAKVSCSWPGIPAASSTRSPSC